eukprot:COSAG06_NODE_58107_length_278_cov_0.575419_1_plen_23_part_01
MLPGHMLPPLLLGAWADRWASKM